MAKSWGQKFDAFAERLGMEQPVVLRPLEPNKPSDWLLRRIDPNPTAYWIVIGLAFGLTLVGLLYGVK